MVAAFAWFFLSEPRNMPDTNQGMNGNEQFGYFFAGSGAWLTFTLLVSSLLNRALGHRSLALLPGMDALRESNYIHAISRTLQLRWRPLVRQWKHT